jgi:hypothetical protein
MRAIRGRDRGLPETLRTEVVLLNRRVSGSFLCARCQLRCSRYEPASRQVRRRHRSMPSKYPQTSRRAVRGPVRGDKNSLEALGLEVEATALRACSLRLRASSRAALLVRGTTGYLRRGAAVWRSRSRFVRCCARILYHCSREWTNSLALSSRLLLNEVPGHPSLGAAAAPGHLELRRRREYLRHMLHDVDGQHLRRGPVYVLGRRRRELVTARLRRRVRDLQRPVRERARGVPRGVPHTPDAVDAKSARWRRRSLDLPPPPPRYTSVAPPRYPKVKCEESYTTSSGDRVWWEVSSV